MVSEKYIVSCVKKFMEKQGFQCYKEVKVLEGRVDLVAIKNKEIVAIEAKVRDWKKILPQVLCCKLFAQKVYAAFWHKYISNIPLQIFKKHGIGLLSVNRQVNIILESRKNNELHRSIYEKLIKEIERRS